MKSVFGPVPSAVWGDRWALTYPLKPAIGIVYCQLGVPGPYPISAASTSHATRYWLKFTKLFPLIAPVRSIDNNFGRLR
jgi:hypothetical protein